MRRDLWPLVLYIVGSVFFLAGSILALIDRVKR
jgi:hypothetical protein